VRQGHGLVLAATFLLVSHVGLSSAGLRTRLAETLGRRVFLILYSVVSLAWMIAAYGNAPFMEVWSQSSGTKWTLILLMSLVCILLVAGVTTVGATITNGAAPPWS
jgi:uncharacterized membrane protein